MAPRHTPQPQNLLQSLWGGVCRLAQHPEGFAAVADEAGLLRYVSLHNTTFSTDSVYQLQYGTELVYQSSEPVEAPHMINRPWTAFEFIPHRARTILFHQSGSNKLLYTTLPDAATASSPVLLFGFHTGLALSPLIQTQTAPHKLLGDTASRPLQECCLLLKLNPSCVAQTAIIHQQA